MNDSGLCENCFRTAKLVSDKQEKKIQDHQTTEPPAAKGVRKRHRSAAVNRSSETVLPLKVSSPLFDLTLVLDG